MLSSWLHGEPQDLIVPHRRVQLWHPVDEMIELHDPYSTDQMRAGSATVADELAAGSGSDGPTWAR